MPYGQFVTKDDFNVEPYVLNIRTEQEADFDAFVLREQNLRLEKLFGNKLFEAFKTGLGPATPDVRWTDLRDGKVYTYFNREYKWKGMKELFIPYIYSQWIASKAFNVTGIGTVEATSENSVVVNSGHKIAKGYNDFAEMAGTGFLLFPTIGTLFGYLYYSDTTYDADVAPDTIQQYLIWYWKDPKYKNVFGI